MNEATVTGNQTRSDDYDASSIPAACGEGTFIATPTATLKDSKAGNPMIQVSWKIDEVELELGDTDSKGRKVIDRLIFPDPPADWSVRKVKQYCIGLGLPVKGSRQELAAQINALGQTKIVTRHQTNKDTGDKEVLISFPSKEMTSEEGEVLNGNGKRRGRK